MNTAYTPIIVTMAATILLTIFSGINIAQAEPSPGVGVYFTAEDVPLMRERINEPPLDRVYQRLLNAANEGMRRWREDVEEHRLDEIADQLVDLNIRSLRRHVPPHIVAASEVLGGGSGRDGHVSQSAPAAAFVYLITGDDEYGRYAWEVFEIAARVPRWGWWSWSGVQMPQIAWGTHTRSMVLIADCVWDMLDEDQRQFAKEIIAEKGVEHYYRLLLHTPAMGLHHLRGRSNQGHNVLSAALIASLFVGEAVPENRIWQRSLLQTFNWSLTHTVDRMSQALQSGGPGGYWNISIHNLYTAVIATRNVLGVDMTPNPGIAEAAMYPILHMTTVPPLPQQFPPIDPEADQRPGIITSNPIEMPAGGGGGQWWLSYAAENPDSPGAYYTTNYINLDNIGGLSTGHQGNLAHVLAIAWWDPLLGGIDPPEPRGLSMFSDRMAKLRSGYEVGDTYLFFRGELFLSAKHELLNAVSGMDWHYTWHQFQEAESGIETEGEIFAPSMVIQDAFDDGLCAYMRAESGTSEINYYRQAEQAASYRNYDFRDRAILYVRPDDDAPDYFILHDRVRHVDGPRWYGWTWHLWNSVAVPENYGRYNIEGPNAVRAQRPNADLWIEFLNQDEMAFEQKGLPSQPKRHFQYDHNGLMLRAIAGGYEPVDAPELTFPAAEWEEDFGELDDEGARHLDPPPTGESVELGVIDGIIGGARYRWSIESRTRDYMVYNGIAWWLELELLDADGDVVAERTVGTNRPHPLLLHSPSSYYGSEDWVEAANYFDAPEDAVAARVKFQARDGAARFQLGKLWLNNLKFEPLGAPQRTDEQRFLTLVMPLDKDAPPPNVRREDDSWVVAHGNGVMDYISLDGEHFVVERMRGQAAEFSFTSALAEEAGVIQLERNSPENARRVAEGLAPIVDDLIAERDELTDRGFRNLALDATITASAERDERFSARNVISNVAMEYPEDGVYDYTLGEVETSGGGGYGRGGRPEQLLDNGESFPLYVRPSYWLLPPFETGWVELELPETTPVSRVRLLNTSNAGLNDFATMRYRVELRDEAGEVLASKEGRFGEAFDRAFDAAFVLPEVFNEYASLYGDMLKPGTPVPFGDGWQEVEFDAAPGVRRVRVVVLDHWAIGGGLNEVQVYADVP